MSFIGCVLRFRLGDRDPSVIEAEVDSVPFTPVWWWWNADADEYVMTLWDTEAGKTKPAMFSFGASDPRFNMQPTKLLVPATSLNVVRQVMRKK